MGKGQNFCGAFPPEIPPGLRHEAVTELSAPRDNFHFTIIYLFIYLFFI